MKLSNSHINRIIEVDADYSRKPVIQWRVVASIKARGDNQPDSHESPEDCMVMLADALLGAVLADALLGAVLAVEEQKNITPGEAMSAVVDYISEAYADVGTEFNEMDANESRR